MPALLHALEVRAPEVIPSTWGMIIHGIFGQGRNWMSIAKRLVQANPQRAFLLIDLRLHGRSLRADPPHTLAACAEDVEAIQKKREIPLDVILGHSFGGKVALNLAQRGHLELNQVWVLDSTPAAMPVSSQASAVLQLMRSIPMPQSSRASLINALTHKGFSSRIAAWLATNLIPHHNGFVWRFDFDGLEALLADFYRTDFQSWLEKHRGAPDLHFIKAERSDVLAVQTQARLEKARAAGAPVHVHTLKDADHWLHVDNPEGLLSLLLPFLGANKGG